VDLFSKLLTAGWSMPTLSLRCGCRTRKACITFNLVSKVMVALTYQYRQQPQPCKPTLGLFTWAGSPSKLDESQFCYAYRYCNYISHHGLKEIQVIQLVQTNRRRRLNWMSIVEVKADAQYSFRAIFTPSPLISFLLNIPSFLYIYPQHFLSKHSPLHTRAK